MPLIKDLVNVGFPGRQAKIIASQEGWAEVDETWSYTSATTITVPTGAASRFQIGDKLRLTQTTVKYFYVVGVADTVLTVTGGADYTLTSDPISAVAYSRVERPFGFPDFFSYTPTIGGVTVSSVTFARFSMKGKLVFVDVQMDLNWINQAVTVTLPISVGLDYAAHGSVYAPHTWEVGLVRININTDILIFSRYDGSFLNATGGQARAAAVYEIG